MGRSRYKFILPNQPHFLTLTVLHWIPIFTRPQTVDILLNSFRFAIREQVKIYVYVMLENLLKQNKVKAILDQLSFYKKAHKDDRDHQLWQEGSHPELILDDDMMRQKIEYIHQNPVNRGYVDEVEHWRCSSARNYAGKEGVLDVCKLW